MTATPREEIPGMVLRDERFSRDMVRTLGLRG